ncbi:MAG: alanine racemase [Solirubrobacterales bacterium]
MTLQDRAPAILTIDLAAVVANYRTVQAAAPGAEVAGVVKADAYGLGVAPVARALAGAGCRSFFVATIDEGIELRAILPEAGAIHVLGGPLPGSDGEFAAHRLTPVLNSMEQVAQWRAFVERGGPPQVTLHLDTGMSRLGIEPANVRRLAEDPGLRGGIRPVVVMSHMACADEDPHPKNREQLDAFRALQALLPGGCPRSLAASSTIYLGSDYHFDLVRPGLALYGGNPMPGKPNPVRPVVGLRGRILQVRDVDSPMTVGYGASHRVTAKGRVATVAVGYADGLFRSLGNRGFGMIGGERVPVVGRISMDLTTFDVSAVPEALAQPGAFIDILGPDHDIDALAAEANTIGYEMLTALGRRFHRVYEGG